MLKLLTTLAGAQLGAMVKMRAERAARTALWGAIAGVLGLIGFVFLLVALAILLTPELGAAGAMATVGGVVVLLAVGAFLIGRMRPRRRYEGMGPNLATFAGAGLGAGVGAAADDDPPPPPKGPSVPTMVAAGLGALLVGLVIGRRI